MSTTIQIKRSSTASGVPLATDLAVGELAVNLADKRLFTKQSDGTIIELSTNPTDLDAATLRIDGVEITASAAELNSLDGFTGSTAELNLLDGLTATTIELNTLDGITASTAELNKLDGYTGSTAELNILDGVTATTAELNYVDGVTSNIQTQLDSKANLSGANFTGNVDVAGDLSTDGLTVDDTTGSVVIDAGQFVVRNPDKDANIFWSALGGDSEQTAILGHGSGTKLQTTATGVDVTGDVSTDTLTINGTTVTATAAELNTLDGITATTTELNYTDGVTSSIQTQLDGKATTAQGALADSAVQPNDNVSFGTGDFSGNVDVTGTIAADAADIAGAITADGLTVSEGNSGATANTNADGVVIENNAKTGMSILTPNNSEGLIFFGDSDDDNIGRIAYNHSSDSMSFTTSNSTRLKIDSSGDIQFYEDTGTTAKMVWSSSAESLGIGTANPSYQLTIEDSTDAIMQLKGSSLGRVYFGDSASDNVGRIQYYHIDNSMQFYTNGTKQATIGSSGNVGIGTASPSVKLDSHSNSVGVRATRASNTDQYIEMVGGDGAGLSHINANYQMAFKVGDSERARLDSSGNLLVGKTSTTGTSASGSELRANGITVHSTANNPSLFLGRLSSDGAIAEFAKDGSTVGSIGTYGNTTFIQSGSGASYAGLLFNSSQVEPTRTSGASGGDPRTDNVLDLGSGGYRFDDIFATNGTIQTSDRNEKQDIEVLNEAEQRVAQACKGLLRKFRWQDSVAEKGDDARIHFGIIAQDLQDAFTAEGLDAGRYAMFISTTWTDEETGEERTRLGVRYPELLAFIISAL